MIDNIVLYAQSIISFVIIAFELKKRKNSNRNFLLIIFLAVFLILVNFQAVWVFNSSFLERRGMIHLTQRLSEESIVVANYYSGLFLLFFVLTYFYLKSSQYKRLQRKIKFSPKKQLTLFLAPSIVSYLATYIIVLTCFYIIANFSYGGFSTFLASSGSISASSTSILLLASIGKIPLFIRLISKSKITFTDYFLFLLVFLLILLNSRFMAGFIVLQILVIINYFIVPINFKNLILGASILFSIFIIYGIYRDNMNYYDYLDLSFFERIQLTFERIRIDSFAIVDWFYGFNVEAFVGLAGLLHYESARTLVHDLGISNLSIFTSLIPNAIRNDTNLPLADIHNYLVSLYPHTGSVVRGGLESFYAHFGVIGILFFGILTSYLISSFHSALYQKPSNKNILIYSLLSVHLLNLTRNSLSVTLFFAIGDLAIFYIYTHLVFLGKRKRKKAFNIL